MKVTEKKIIFLRTLEWNAWLLLLSSVYSTRQASLVDQAEEQVNQRFLLTLDSLNPDPDSISQDFNIASLLCEI